MALRSATLDEERASRTPGQPSGGQHNVSPAGPARLDIATVARALDAQIVPLFREDEAMPSGTRVVPAIGDPFQRSWLSVADLRRPIGQVTIDSRTAGPGSLFVALKGEHVDGHDYVPAALAAGAVACIVSRVSEDLPAQKGELTSLSLGDRPRFLIIVPDTLVALQQLATYWRLHQRADVVGVTGSVGKTTVKEILSSVLAARWSVLKSEANLNTEIGLPLMLLRLTDSHQLAVLEMGMHAPGDIALLAEIARPRIGVVINVAPVHLERMGTIERIAREKSRLITALPADGLAVLNGDDRWTRAMAEASGIAPVRLVGLGPGCDYRAVDVRSHGIGGLSFSLRAEGHRLDVRTHVPGAHTVHAMLAAAAVAREEGMEWEEILRALESVRLDVRQRLLSFREPAHGAPVLLIDDSYNASPPSMKAALDLLASAPAPRIAVLGDMLELGPNEEEAHREVGALAARVADWLVVCGQRSGWTADEAEKAGLPPERVLRSDSNDKAARAVASILAVAPEREPDSDAEPDDPHRASVGPRTMSARGRLADRTLGGGEPLGEPEKYRWSILVKGSRGMRMEEVVEALRGEG